MSVKSRLAAGVLFAALFILPAGAYAVAGSEALPEIASFQVNPSSVNYGGSAVLSWKIVEADQAIIDHGIGLVSLTGQTAISPGYTTTYKLMVSNQTGMRSRYITIHVEPGPTGHAPAVDYDPVTGRNAQVDLSWESYCQSDEYQVQIARDQAFTLIMYDSGSMRTADSLSPAIWYPPGNLEAGHIYYWRVRSTRAATGQRILGYWSEAKSFTVSPGYSVRTASQGIQALSPANGCASCPVKPLPFSWSGYPGTARYVFIMAKDPGLQNVVVETTISGTSYTYTGLLDYDTGYFWQAYALEPAGSDASPVFSFRTEAAPVRTGSTASPAMPAWAIAVITAGVLLIFAAILVIAGINRRNH